MELKCPFATMENSSSDKIHQIVRFGYFFRQSDKAIIQRFKCSCSAKSFSKASFELCYRQRKRSFNNKVAELLVSGVSQRRAAKLLRLNRKTVVRKFIFLGILSQRYLFESNFNFPLCKTIEFDDLETCEHTKLKPLSVTMAVEYKTRRILGFRVARMPAKGHLATLSKKKYGRRRDERSRMRAELFFEIKHLIRPEVLIKSDESPHYPMDVKRFFPKAQHKTFKGQKGAIAGQGELKKLRFDPLFSINHTFAQLRADINRLFRRTWCITKKSERLSLHLAIYGVFRNGNLKFN